MGDRTWWTEECPKCHKNSLEVYDAPSCMQHSERCPCGYDAKTYYYERKDGVIILKRKRSHT
jgi:hypothetical protein